MKNRLLIPLLLIMVGCVQKPDVPEPVKDPLKQQKEYVKKIMTDVYYWASETPELKIADYTDVETLFTSYLVKKDRWSWMLTGKEFLNSEAGISTEYGISLRQPIYYNDHSVKVALVKHNSPMSELGVKRGWTLTHLNGTPVMTLITNGTFNKEFAKSSNKFTFLDHNNQSVTLSAVSREIHSRSVYLDSIFTNKEFPALQHKVGYMQYSTFNANMLDDIRNTIARFKAEGVGDMILDLRYNGGGDSRATQLLANLIAPASANGKVLQKYIFNSRYSSRNEAVLIQRESGALELSRIYIIATNASASASEVIINGLRPLVNVIQVGTTTYGKPNGMYVLTYPENNPTNPEYVFLPICFYSVNSVDFGSYEDGLIPNIERGDDLYHDFGVEEDLIKTCLTMIATGSIPESPTIKSASATKSVGVRMTTPMDEPGYGRFTVVRE